MNFIETLHLETLGNDSDSIRSLFNGLISRHENSPVASFESTVFSKLFANIHQRISLKDKGDYIPIIVDQYKIDKNWLEVKEIVVELPITYNNANIATICGHILKSREVIGGSEALLDSFITRVASYISDPSKLSAMSGIEPVVTVKNSTIHGTQSMGRMIDLTRGSRTKLERLFNSVSDMNVAVNMSNDLNTLLGNVNIVSLNDKANRLVEIIEVLEETNLDNAMKRNTVSIIGQTKMLAMMLSDISYVFTIADRIGTTLQTIHDHV